MKKPWLFRWFPNAKSTMTGESRRSATLLIMIADLGGHCEE